MVTKQLSVSFLKKIEKQKSSQFQQNQKLNDLLNVLKTLLQPIQISVENKFVDTIWPVGFVIGNARSGMTLMTQWLASLEFFSYPTNVLARFAYSPYIGALIQQMLFDIDYDFHGDFADIQSKVNFDSDLGKSKGALAVNEFHHFFRNYMEQTDPCFLDEKELKKVDFNGMKKGLASIEYVFNKPYITKAGMLKYNIDALQKNVKSIFYFIQRDPLCNMQSLYLARQKYFQSVDIWYGSKPEEYDDLQHMDIYHQIAGQVFFTNKKIKDKLKDIEEENKIEIQYEAFCINPEYYYRLVQKKYRFFGYEIDNNYKGPSKFDISNKILLEKDKIKKLECAYAFFDK